MFDYHLIDFFVFFFIYHLGQRRQSFCDTQWHLLIYLLAFWQQD